MFGLSFLILIEMTELIPTLDNRNDNSYLHLTTRPITSGSMSVLISLLITRVWLVFLLLK